MGYKSARTLISAIICIIGLIFVLHGFSGITGYIILGKLENRISSFLGSVLIIGSIIIFSYDDLIAYIQRAHYLRNALGKESYDALSKEEQDRINKSYRRHNEKEARREESTASPQQGLVQIVRTEHFDKAVERHNPKIIERAIEKLRVGKGKTEWLKYIKRHSIRVTNSGRITYDVADHGRKIILRDYTPDHKYERTR